MANQTISLVLIVRDVEKTIDKCLQSFQSCVDEIVIVDTGSIDNTLEIIKRYTDKIYHFEWIDDFSAARNFSFEKCTKDYLLWCDGDDYILPADVEKLKNYDFEDKDIIICPYVYAHDKYGNDELITARERIIKRSLNLKWQEEIHEYIPLNGLKMGISDIKIHHNKQYGTSERNLTILERIIEKNPSSRNLYYLAKEYTDFGRHDEAIEYFHKFLDCEGAFWENVYQAHTALANCFLIKGDEKKFKEHILESIKIEDRQAEPFYYMGLYYLNKGLENNYMSFYSRAIPWFETCLNIRRPPELFASYRPKFYTWAPAINLVLCYNTLGEIQKAYDYNNKVLEYRPNYPEALKNKKILQDALNRKKSNLKDGKGKKLNLGCGGKTLEGYVNVDLFHGSKIDEVFDLDDIPYKDNTISKIYSEHALEHVSFNRAEKAIREWFRVLKPGGEVELYMPDFEECCRSYLNAPLESNYFMKTRAWFKLTIYGVQESQGGEPDDAQIHKCGFSKEEIRIVMERNGFIVNSVENYGGLGQKPSYGTPSMAIIARKPGGLKLKIGWISTENWVAAQTRIRVLNVNKWLQEQGYDSSIINFQEASDYDVIIVGKKFNQEVYDNIKKLKEQGKIVYCDLCEDLIGWAFVNEILELCDKVICCSSALEEKVRPINSNTCIIEDAWEVNYIL